MRAGAMVGSVETMNDLPKADSIQGRILNAEGISSVGVCGSYTVSI